MKTVPLLLLSLAVIASNIPSYSQDNYKKMRPTEITCESAQVENDGTNASFVFMNNVQLLATNLELRCDRLEVYTLRRGPEDAAIGDDFSPVQRIVAIGDVSIAQAERTATAGRLEMKPNEDSITLYENPVVVQAGVTFTGPELIIERGKGRIFIPGNERDMVRFVGPAIRDFGFDEDDPEQMEEAVKIPTEVEDPSALGEPIDEDTSQDQDSQN